MFVYSVRLSTVRFVGVVLLSVVTLVTLLTFVPTDDYQSTGLFSERNKTVYTGAASAEGREAFAAQFGWKLSRESELSEDILIPGKFDDTYTSYNALQKAQGLNLEKYAGKEVKRYSYIITNYPEYDGEVRLTMLINGDKVIGGDVSASVMNGFTHGFAKES